MSFEKIQLDFHYDRVGSWKKPKPKPKPEVRRDNYQILG
jgi:hypothetical protein